MNKYGYYRLATVVPQVRVADVEFNTTELINGMNAAVAKGAQLVLFPELCFTSAACADLFHHHTLLDAALNGLQRFCRETSAYRVPTVVSLPLLADSRVYNVAVVVYAGKVLGAVPKSVLPNRRESNESRVFSSAAALRCDSVELCGESVPYGTDLLFRYNEDLCFGIEFGDDMCAVIPPSAVAVQQGATVIVTPAYAPEYVGVSDYRKMQVCALSGSQIAVRAYAAAGVGESTQDSVCAGQSIIAANGKMLAEGSLFSRDLSLTLADVDVQALKSARLSEYNFGETHFSGAHGTPRVVNLEHLDGFCDLQHAEIPSRPFVPAEQLAAQRCEQILNIQATALAKRIEHTRAQTLVLGVSGGLDSTLALLVCDRANKMLGRSNETILALTMPGFGTTGRTYQNAVRLIQLLGCTFKEVNIKEACLLHFKDLDFDPALRTNTYENVQARERTKLLMNLANKTGGMVVGTGDLSEIALGWATYNGDHMSMYSVNCSVPKTLIRCLIAHAATQSPAELAEVLNDVNATPVSPELLPPADDGSIEQKTEDVLGPYDLHDFFLYHFIKYGASKEKLLALALHAFEGEFESVLIEKTLATFMRRFFTQQFKRTCVPDGPKVGTVALSPRGDWRMPTDVCGILWQ